MRNDLQKQSEESRYFSKVASRYSWKSWTNADTRLPLIHFRRNSENSMAYILYWFLTLSLCLHSHFLKRQFVYINRQSKVQSLALQELMELLSWGAAWTLYTLAPRKDWPCRSLYTCFLFPLFPIKGWFHFSLLPHHGRGGRGHSKISANIVTKTAIPCLLNTGERAT